MSSSTPEHRPLHFAGIDVGGTKIEASLFDADVRLLSTRRLATPRGSYSNLREVLLEEIAPLQQQAGAAELRVGIGLPGVFDRETGQSVTANLVADGFPLRDDLRTHTVAERLSGALTQSALAGLKIQPIASAKFGERSGTRGAAILARQMENDRA